MSILVKLSLNDIWIIEPFIFANFELVLVILINGFNNRKSNN